MRIWRRRKRYALTVITLLTLVFVGIGTVLGILATSALRPLPFARPGELFRVISGANGGADLWALDEFKRIANAVPEVSQVAAMSNMERPDVLLNNTSIAANVVVTTPNFFPVLGISTGGSPGVPGTA